MDAAKELKDANHVLLGRRERLFSNICDRNLLDVMYEATKQDVRNEELGRVMDFFKGRKSIDNEKVLYTKTLLMAGRLDPK